ncbi:caspase family protein [Hydrogenophaga sp.]|uniref:caspase family protein n=1 Tax=Hydrogenophaga sp. TaxID=1904254 RepID=UPI0025BB7674|nr:caspase family protein [Hydrogenophaga sp.]
MNLDDYAILVGIDSYPELGKGDTPAHLHGPLNDVDAVRSWLTDPLGGGLPSANVIEISSVDRDKQAPGRPNFSDVNRLLATLHKRGRSSGKSQFGRRIYIYMSGHGFSPGRTRACLYTADARLEFGQNVHATGWLDWLQDSGYFREFVLWVDACMDRQYFFPPGEPGLKPINVNVPPMANFVAFAAQRPLKAIEHPIAEDRGVFHGAFTWALLQGLRGAAADVNGRVTGRSLADWVRNAMSARYEPRDRLDRDVAKEPEVIAEDSSMIFVRGAVPPDYDITLRFPAAALGAQARIWTGAPPAVVQVFMVNTPETTLLLRPGLYVLETDIGGLRHGFEVLRSDSIELKDKGLPVEISPAGVFKLDIDPGNLSAEIFVIDGRFSLVDFSPARISTPLPPGLFKIKVRVSNAVTEHVILLDRDHRVVDGPGTTELPATVIPLSATAATHETHELARKNAVSAAMLKELPEGTAALMLMVRTFSSRDDPVPNTTPPWQGVQIVDDAGQVVLDMEGENGVVRTEVPDGTAYASVVVNPGCYYLRQRLNSPTAPFTDGQADALAGPSYPIEQSVIACAGWRTEVYILRRVVPGAREVDGRPRVAIAMRRHDRPMTAGTQAEDLLAETAKLALASERRVLNKELESALMLKSGNPIASIIGGHLLLVEQERDPGRDISMLDIVVANLRKQVGDGHPDVEALALRCRDTKASGTITGPPMFQRSWAVLVQAAFKQPDLVPAPMWARVQASSGLPPFMVWTTDKDVKAAALRQLTSIVLGKKATAAPKVVTPSAVPLDLQPELASSSFAHVRVVREGSANCGPATAQTFNSVSRAARARAIAMNLPPSSFEVLGDGS